jgi:fructose-1,6-bisphosphatase/inositol monophosphatase family enzyme
MAGLPDPAAVARLIREAAEAEILPRFQKLGRGEVREKSPGQLVTDADVAAEHLLTRTLGALLPAAVVGEESVAADASALEALNRPGPVWVIDPVDGTANFAHGRPRFAVIVALVVDGITEMGWIHDPVPNRTVFAARGRGAWLDGQRLAVLPEAPLAEMRGSVKRSASIKAQVAQVGRLGSAAHDYLDLVLGRLHFAHYRQLMPWDHAAGVLIHAEAGGTGRLTDGAPYQPVATPAALLLAPGPRSWEQLNRLIA